MKYFNTKFPNLEKIILINTFVELDDIIIKFFNDFLTEINENKTIKNDNFPFYFYSTLVSSNFERDNCTNNFEKNPISIMGREVLIKGLLNSTTCKDIIKNLEYDILIIHSLVNCLVNLNHAQIIKSNNNTDYDRIIEFIEGNHEIIFKNNDKLINIINNYLQN